MRLLNCINDLMMALDENRHCHSNWKFLGYDFVCVKVLRPSQPSGVMSSAVSLPNYTFTGQAKSSKRFTSIVYILSPETDNCPSWISGRERMTVENISWSISTKECCRPRRGLNPRPPGSKEFFGLEYRKKSGLTFQYVKCRL